LNLESLMNLVQFVELIKPLQNLSQNHRHLLGQAN
jgi:hypothetical protein